MVPSNMEGRFCFASAWHAFTNLYTKFPYSGHSAFSSATAVPLPLSQYKATWSPSSSRPKDAVVFRPDRPYNYKNQGTYVKESAKCNIGHWDARVCRWARLASVRSMWWKGTRAWWTV